jgi:hypothetical protein
MEQFYVFANSEDSLNIFNVGNIFVQDTQRLENGNVGIIHKITAHVDPSRRCGQLGDESNLQKCTFR